MNELIRSDREVILICLSGPDQGKRLAIRDRDVILGRSVHCNLLSDDHDVAEQHIRFILKDGRATCQSLGGSTVFLDGHRIQDAVLNGKQQIRIGRSLWQITDATIGEEGEGWLEHLSGRISSVAGMKKFKASVCRACFLRSFASDETKTWRNTFMSVRCPQHRLCQK